MANKIETEKFGDGLKIDRFVSTDSDMVVPDSINGVPIKALGSRFLMGSPNADSRTITIPSSVESIARDAFSGIIGLREIHYLGEFEVFNSFNLIAEYDCRVVSSNKGMPVDFPFLSGYPMSFPAFDDAILSVSFKMSPEVAMKRLRDPLMLTEKNAAKYTRYMRDRTMPLAEHAVTTNDRPALEEVVRTGLLDTDGMRTLLKRSLRSGKTSMTSAIMSMIRRME